MKTIRAVYPDPSPGEAFVTGMTVTPLVSISEQSARAVLRLLEDVRDVNDRARCSDAFFRQHFLTMARIPAIIDAAAEIKGALDAMEAG